MSVLTYNGITLPYCFTTKFSQDAVYDDVGKTDWCGTRYDIQVQAVLNADYLSMIAPDYPAATATNAADVMNKIRVDLLQPRRTLLFSFNDVSVIPERAGVPGTVDIRNGPQPQSCTVIQATDTTFLISYHIVAHYWENYATSSQGPDTGENRPGNPVVYNRWTETMDIDNCGYTRRVRDGMYMIRSDNVQGKIADEFRDSMAVVGLIPGFLRESSSYTQTPDGLGVKYRIVDKEVFKPPPAPAFEAQGEYVETVTRRGAVRYGEARVLLKGSKNTPQEYLVIAALQVVHQKLSINGATLTQTGDGFSLLDYSTLQVGMYENTVEYRCRCMLTARKARVNGADSFYGAQTFTPISDSNPGYTPPYKTRGSAGLVLQAAAYFDPDLQSQLGPGPYFWTSATNVADDDNTQMNRGVIPGRAGVVQET